LSSLIVASNEIQDDQSKLIKTGEMVRLQEFALEKTEPDFDLIEPGSISREPIEPHGQFFIRRCFQFLDPLGELLGGVGWTIIEDQRYRLYTTTVGFCKDNRL